MTKYELVPPPDPAYLPDPAALPSSAAMPVGSLFDSLEEANKHNPGGRCMVRKIEVAGVRAWRFRCEFYNGRACSSGG